MSRRQTNRYVSDEGKEVWKQLEHVSRFGYDYPRVFMDFTDLALNSLLALTDNMRHEDIADRIKENRLDGIYNDRYLEIVGRYRENKDRPRGERPIDYFCTAWGMLQAETREKNRDILGQIYMERVTHGEAGQYFTPHEVAYMMAKMIVGERKPGERVLDPCCGSGRFLIAVSHENPDCNFFAKDIDLRCAKMTALNMWMFDLNATIMCGNGLTDDWSVAWKTWRGGYVREYLPAPVEEKVATEEERTAATAELQTPAGLQKAVDGQMELF